MKLKNILGAAIATAAVMLMTTTAFAATSFEIGKITATKTGTEELTNVSTGANVWVPVYYSSGDYDKLANFDVSVKYKSSDYTYASVSNNATRFDEDEGMNVPIFNISAGAVDDTKVQVLAYGLTATGSDPYVQASNYTKEKGKPLFWVKFTGASDHAVSSSDFEIKVSEASYFLSKEQNNEKIAASEFATYVVCDAIPEDGTGWEGKHILALRVDIKEAGTSTVLKSGNVKQYYVDEAGKCVFVVKLLPGGTKKVVDVDFVAEYASKSTATEKEDEEIVQSFTNVAVEALS